MIISPKSCTEPSQTVCWIGKKFDLKHMCVENLPSMTLKSAAAAVRAAWGSLSLSYHRRSTGNAADAKFLVGGSNPGRLIVVGGSGAVFGRPGFEPPTEKTLVSSITIRPLLGLRRKASALLGTASTTEKNPKCVFLSD